MWRRSFGNGSRRSADRGGNHCQQCLLKADPRLLHRHPALLEGKCPQSLTCNKERHMPTTAFNSFTDRLDSNQRSREHFIANINVDDNRRWVPYAEGVWIQPCCFSVTSGGFSVVLKGLPGAKLGTHYHVGTVRGYTMRGRWRYLEHDWVAEPGTFIYEPAGESHTLGISHDSPEPAGN